MELLLFEQYKIDLTELIASAIKKLGGEMDLLSIAQNLVNPPQREMGHKAFGLFPLAKSLRKGPPVLAPLLQAAVEELLLTSPRWQQLIARVQAVGPYLNFFFHLNPIGQKLIGQIQDGSYFAPEMLSHPPRTMIEYSQPNTHKELHVGHLRNLSLGNALVQLHRYCRIPTTAVTFPGDVGTHVAKCLWYLKDRYQGAIPTTQRGKFLGDIYVLATAQLDLEKGTSDEEITRARLTQILRELHAKEGEFYDLWLETRQWSLDLMNKIYDWAGVKFDRWYFESDVDASSVALAQAYYKSGHFVESQGAIGMDLSAENLGFCLMIKSDGNGLYITKDLALARQKFEEFAIEKSVYVVDDRQSHHFKQLFTVLKKLGFSYADHCSHLAYDMVELPDGAMSSRKGNVVPIEDLITQMEAKITSDYLEQYRGQWSDEEIALVARQVAQGAIHYGMLKVDPNKKIIFNLQEWLKLDGDSGPYLQYCGARINSLVKRLSAQFEGVPLNGDEYQHASEEALLLKLLDFNAIVRDACLHARPSLVANYLFDLCKLFNSFYVECSIGNAPTPASGRARLNLAMATQRLLRQGLALLGIPIPERM